MEATPNPPTAAAPTMNDLVVVGSTHEVVYFAIRAAIALALGALVGLERQWRQRMAGLRTNALVALGAALFELLAVSLSNQHGSDPTRIAAYVVSGVGFLGAGVILRDGVNVRGINTAATIWCSSAVGLLAGDGRIIEAVIAALLIVTVNLALRPVARRIDRAPATDDTEIDTTYQFSVTCKEAKEAHIRALLTQSLAASDFVLHALRSQDLERPGLVHVQAELHLEGRDDLALEQAVNRISLEPSVSSVSWTVITPTESAIATEQ